MASAYDLSMAAVDFGVIVALIGTSGIVLREVRLLGRDVVMARLFLVRQGTERITIMLFVALFGLLVSNALHLSGSGIGNVVETASLLVIFVALAQVARILHQLSSARPVTRVPS